MLKEIENLGLDSKIIGPLPIINHFIDRLNLADVLSKYIYSKKNQKLSNTDSILIFVKNILIRRQPLYGLSEWAEKYDPSLIGLFSSPLSILNDDRVGRSLDHLFDADRATLLTEIVLNAINEFNIDILQLHNDSTTVTVHGEYKAKRSIRKGKTSIAIAYGHNKDHRPDLKQLLFTLTVSRDGAVPIHYKSFDGNTTDDKTHIQIWENLRRISGKSDFIYVADSKLCTREQMYYIAKEGGLFISVLPKTRKECSWFKEWFRGQQPVRWTELLRKPNHRRPESEEHVYWGFESPMNSEEGYRIIWILSSQKQEQDAQIRGQKIEKTIDELARLKEKTGSRKWKTKEQITSSVLKIFDKHSSSNWFDWKIITQEDEIYRQKGKGRPSKNTEYVRIIKTKWTFEAMPNSKKIQDDAASDGMFPLITNISEKKFTMKDILLKYKYQPYIEKRHQQFKSVFDAAPVFLKSIHRIEALMFVYFIALLLNALIERELRNSMKQKEIELLPLYPEERNCKYPTTERILSLFENQRKHILKENNIVLKQFYDPVSDLHKSILNLLKISKKEFGI